MYNESSKVFHGLQNLKKRRWKKFTASIQQDTVVGYYRNPKRTSESRVLLSSYSVTVLPGDMHSDCPDLLLS